MSSKKTINDFHRCIIILLYLSIVTFYLTFFSSLSYADIGNVHSIHGTVTINNLSGNAIALIDVRAEEVIGAYPSVDTRVDADGHYSILVYEGTYNVKCTVYISYPENNSYSSFDYFIASSQSVTRDTELNVTIPAVQLSGVVTDTSGKPIPGTTISGGGVLFLTGSDGGYQFDMLSGTYTFGVIPPPNSPFARTSITIKISANTVKKIVLEKTISIHSTETIIFEKPCTSYSFAIFIIKLPRMKTWNRKKSVYPLSAIEMKIGEPIDVTNNNFEYARYLIERELG